MRLSQRGRPVGRRPAGTLDSVSTALLLLPDFLLIAAGWVLCRYTALNRGLWDGVERLVYYLLFPVLLFTSILKSPLQPAATLGLAPLSLLFFQQIQVSRLPLLLFISLFCFLRIFLFALKACT